MEYSMKSLRKMFSIMEELWYAWRKSRQLLARCQRILRDQPGRAGRPLYEAVLNQQRPGADPAVARLLADVEYSCCQWPSERTLKFRDIVLYVITLDYLHSHPTRVGMLTDVRRLVARVIPKEL